MLTTWVSQTNFKFLLTILFAISTLPINAQSTESLSLKYPVNNFWQKSIVKKTTVPLILFSATALAWPHRQTVREVRNRFIPDFRYKYDDYLQYAPAAALVALNAFNVKGKHTPKRTLISYAFSMGIMGAMVNGIKSTAKVQRPDESANNSFPSGHTATAFMNATMLDKEYGQYGYPLIGITGYAMATATALGRGLNNRHWITDVLTGAGIGIISTELGYFVTEQIMKNRGMNAPLKNNPVPISNHPSFIELHAGYAIATEKKLTGTAQENIFNKTGFNLGMEGAWFINKNFGIGGELAFTSFPLNSDRAVLDPDILEISNGLYTQALGVKYLNIGPYFSLPLANNWFITAKVNAGISAGSNGNFILNIKPEYQKDFGTDELPYIRYKPQTASSWSAGIGIQKRIGRNTAIKAYTSYFGSTHKFDIEILNDRDNDGRFIYEPLPGNFGRTKYNNISFGLGITAFIW